ncbi:SAM-dependent methyltransferase [Acetobacter sp. TBRC 12305]|uniref:SAM-dependent methyltransferase n=1 Tax=Acetobacter garciniae TaxID=2817435 RepID=A0A939KQE0_9PROT|nr:SAM-dependent methyltransferase [Acetobacter garciniae]MBO1325212.1 SAM-dependent methyltransferase [Acetobacter garciniae]MBX0344817.1 SAM-dependent methyltransferase [Acetobacter garciniae]
MTAPPPHALRLDRFMAQANAQYYATTPLLSDFITAPEISQVFGELLGGWAAMVWQGMGRPDPFILAEAGPGRGTLMADALRLISRQVPAMARAMRVHLVETSPLMRAAQAQALRPYAQPVWHDSVADLPPGPLILLGNEFLDALPIRQFVQAEGGWHERHVADGVFHLILCPAPILPDGRTLEEGAVVELCEPALEIARLLGHRLAHTPGAALFLDYGHASTLTGDSLQALRHARQAPPLEAAGEADLTAHVDFTAFGAAARQAGATVYGAQTQGAFLLGLGLMERTEQLARATTPDNAAALRSGAERLAAPEKMGHLFRVMALQSASLPPPPGFTKGPAA